MFVPSDDWINAFNAQCTDELWKKLKPFAARCARGVDKAGGVVDDYYVRELVQDVLADTRLGVLRWDPSAKSLEEHARDAIASRAYHDRGHAKRYPRESIDAFDPDSSHATMAAVEASLQDQREASLHTAALVENVLTELRELAAGDSVVLRLLDAYEVRATTKADVMLVTELSDRTYHAARTRLDRLITRLSPRAQPNRARSLPDSRPILAKGDVHEERRLVAVGGGNGDTLESSGEELQRVGFDRGGGTGGTRPGARGASGGSTAPA